MARFRAPLKRNGRGLNAVQENRIPQMPYHFLDEDCQGRMPETGSVACGAGPLGKNEPFFLAKIRREQWRRS